MEIIDVLNKLIGHTDAFGESNYDKASLENLEIKISVIDSLVRDLIDTVPAKTRYERSMQRIGKRAYEYLKELRSMTVDFTE